MPVPSRSLGVWLVCWASRPIWCAGPMHEHHADAQTAQQGDVQHEVAEVLVLDHDAVEGDDEDALAKAGHITQDFTKVGKTHGKS